MRILSNNIYFKIFTLRIKTTGIAVQISFGKVDQDSLPFLGFSRQRELSEKLSESYIQCIPLKVKITQILLCHSSAKIVAVNRILRFHKTETFGRNLIFCARILL